MLNGYINWLTEAALPTWAERGFDARAERFHERLDFSGIVADAPLRSMVQARQIYVYTHAAVLGWYPAGGNMAEGAMASLIRDFAHDDGHQASFDFSINRSGRTLSKTRDAYGHAFILFALAWLYRLNGDRKLLDLADRIFVFIDTALVDPVHGGLYDAFPVANRSKRQNPLMHLLEACLFLSQSAPDRGYLKRAGRLVDLFRARLFKRTPGVLLEYFAWDWQPHENADRASIFEPGHHMEWVWLLRRYSDLSGEALTEEGEILFETAVRHGFASSGLIYDEVGSDLVPRKLSHRVWPHTEAMKAAVARRTTCDEYAGSVADKMADVLMHTFLNRPFEGGWIDRVDEARNPLVDYVPASSLYHLFLAGAEAARSFAITPLAAKIN